MLAACDRRLVTLGLFLKRNADFKICVGPAGNGKTISIKALMHSLFKKHEDSIPSLYVKAAPRTWDIRNIFVQARLMAPCLLVFEDIDTIVTPGSRSYFFNEVDVSCTSFLLIVEVLMARYRVSKTMMVSSWWYVKDLIINFITYVPLFGWQNMSGSETSVSAPYMVLTTKAHVSNEKCLHQHI